MVSLSLCGDDCREWCRYERSVKGRILQIPAALTGAPVFFYACTRQIYSRTVVGIPMPQPMRHIVKILYNISLIFFLLRSFKCPFFKCFLGLLPLKNIYILRYCVLQLRLKFDPKNLQGLWLKSIGRVSCYSMAGTYDNLKIQ